MEAMTLSQLLATRIAAKRREDEAIAERREIDAKITTALGPPAAGSGTVSQKLDGLKVTVTHSSTSKVDTDTLKAAWDKLPANVQATFRWKAEPIAATLKLLTPDETLIASKFITTTPATPSVKIDIA